MSEDRNKFDQNTKIPPEMFDLLNQTEIKDEIFKTKPIGFFRDSMNRFRKNKAAIVAFWIIIIIILLSIFGPALNEYGWNDQNIRRRNMPPRIPVLENIGIANGARLLHNRRLDVLDDLSRYPEGSVIGVRNERYVMDVAMGDVLVNYYIYRGMEDEYFWFGTDALGRDILTRLFRGSRISLIIAFVSVAVNLVIGALVGAIIGYYGGKVDMISMRAIEIINGIPWLVMIVLFVLFVGTGMWALIGALVIRGWIGTMFIMRAQFYRFKGREYVLAARTQGVPDRKLIFRHIMPNTLAPLITASMFAVPGAIFTEAFLAFIGLGLAPPEPSIGILLADGQRVLLHYPFLTVIPAVLISVLILSFNLFANGLRDALDPTMRGEE